MGYRSCGDPGHAYPHALPRSAEGVHSMGMPAPRPITTIEELLALPEDGLRHELLDGVHVVTPAQIRTHQRVLGELHLQLRSQVSDDSAVEVLFSPADIRLGPRTLVQPDMFIVAKPADDSLDDWAHTPVPLLAVEVLSPSTASRDRGVKRRLYLDAGVEEYWIVDLDARLIERWQKGDERPAIIDDHLEWSLGPGVGGTIEVAKLFG